MDEKIPLDLDLYSNFINQVKAETDVSLCPITLREPDSSVFIVPEQTTVLFSVSN